MSQALADRPAMGVIAATVLFTLIGVAVTVASLTLCASHKDAAFGLVPMFMGAILWIWGVAKLIRLMTARPSRGTA